MTCAEVLERSRRNSRKLSPRGESRRKAAFRGSRVRSQPVFTECTRHPFGQDLVVLIALKRSVSNEPLAKTHDLAGSRRCGRETVEVRDLRSSPRTSSTP